MFRSYTNHYIPQSAGAVEYTNYIFAEGLDSPNKCPGYDTKQSDGEAPVMQELWEMRRFPFIAIAPRSTMINVLSMGQIQQIVYLR